MNHPAHRTDEELFNAYVSGDDLALAALAGRHGRGVYDFALRSTMDEGQASEITEHAFERLRTTRELPAQIEFRTWLYSLALVEVLSVANERSSGRLSIEDRRFLRTDQPFDAELLLWAWQAARGLRTRDYCVLDLTLRRGMSPEELADSASLTRSNLYASIGRARGAFEETFGATVLFMRGRQSCPELDTLVSSNTGSSVRLALRHQIADHADACDACRATLSSMPLASEVFVALLDVELPDTLPAQLVGGQMPTSSPAEAEVAAEAGVAVATEGVETDEEVTTGGDGEALPAFVPTPRASGRAVSPATEEELFRAFAEEPEPETPKYGYKETFSDKVAMWIDSARGQPISFSWLLGGIATVVAIYLALAIGDSLQGGGGDAGAVPLNTTPGVETGRVIDCGSSPIALENGASSVVSFDVASLDGFEIGGLAVVPQSQAASASGLTAKIEDAHSIAFEAAKAQSTTARTDTYQLRISWKKSDEIATSQCAVSVRVPATPS
jgi:DNA-directed RNA polymerase specialized sigma24 family protein